MFSVGFTIYQAVADDQFKFYFIHLANLNLCATMTVTFLSAVLATMFFSKLITNVTETTFVFKFYWFLWNQCLVFSCVTSPYYWIFLYKGEHILANVLTHCLNPILMIIDLCVVKHPGRYYNFFYMLIVQIVYLIFTGVYQAAGGLNE